MERQTSETEGMGETMRTGEGNRNRGQGQGTGKAIREVRAARSSGQDRETWHSWRPATGQGLGTNSPALGERGQEVEVETCT